MTSAHLRALSAAEVQSSKRRNAVHARAHERNLPGRDGTPNSPGRQAPRRTPCAGEQLKSARCASYLRESRPISHRQVSPAAVLSSRSRLQPALPQSVAEPVRRGRLQGAGSALCADVNRMVIKSKTTQSGMICVPRLLTAAQFCRCACALIRVMPVIRTYRIARVDHTHIHALCGIFHRGLVAAVIGRVIWLLRALGR
jgi:hypothetical protein